MYTHRTYGLGMVAFSVDGIDFEVWESGEMFTREPTTDEQYEKAKTRAKELFALMRRTLPAG